MAQIQAQPEGPGPFFHPTALSVAHVEQLHDASYVRAALSLLAEKMVVRHPGAGSCADETSTDPSNKPDGQTVLRAWNHGSNSDFRPETKVEETFDVKPVLQT